MGAYSIIHFYGVDLNKRVLSISWKLNIRDIFISVREKTIIYFDIQSVPRNRFEDFLLVSLNIQTEIIDSRLIQRQ